MLPLSYWVLTHYVQLSLSLVSGSSRQRLSAPSGWTQSLSTLDIPIRNRSHRSGFLAKDQDDKTEPRNSHESREPFGESKKQQDLTPDSALPGSILKWNSQDQSDDEVSIYTAFDRGYTAAEQRHSTKTVSSAEFDTPGLFEGIGAHSGSNRHFDALIRSSLQSYGGIQESDNVWLPFDKLFQLVNEGSVYQELSDLPNNVLTTDELMACAKQICGPIIYKDEHDNVLKSSSRSIFAILTLMQEVQSAPEFVKAGLSDKDLPLGRRSNQTTGKDEFYSISYPSKRWHGARKWNTKEFDYFLYYQRYMLSPFFELSSNVVPFYDLYASTLLPFIEDGEKTRRRDGYHGSVWRVKIHPAHHDFNVVLSLPSSFSLLSIMLTGNT